MITIVAKTPEQRPRIAEPKATHRERHRHREDSPTVLYNTPKDKRGDPVYR